MYRHSMESSSPLPYSYLPRPSQEDTRSVLSSHTAQTLRIN